MIDMLDGSAKCIIFLKRGSRYACDRPCIWIRTGGHGLGCNIWLCL